jgi:hypothetical protein
LISRKYRFRVNFSRYLPFVQKNATHIFSSPMYRFPGIGSEQSMTRWSFTKHPASVGETYWQHMRAATRFGLRLAWAAFACLVHALLPFLFTTTGSSTVADLQAKMLANRKQRKVGEESGGFEGSTSDTTPS